MESGFKLVKPKQLRHRKYPYVTITKSGNLYLNINAIRKMNLLRQRYVYIFYNADEKIIALKPSPEETEATFVFSVNKKKQGGYIACKSFLGEIGLYHRLFTSSQKLRYRAIWSEKEKMLYIPLTQEGLKKFLNIEASHENPLE